MKIHPKSEKDWMREKRVCLVERIEESLSDGSLNFFLIDGAIRIIIESAEAEIFTIDLEKLRRIRSGLQMQIIMLEVKK